MIRRKSKIKKLVSLVLVCATLASPVLFGSCSEGAKDEDINNSGDPAASDQTGENQEQVPEELTDKVPELNFNGYDITILNNDLASVNMNIIMEPEENLAEVINEAAYRRSTEIKERLNINITEVQVDYTNRPTIFKNDVLSGSPVYDISMLEQNRAFAVAQEGLIYNINDLKYVDLDMPWYDQNARKSYSIGNKAFFVPGAYELSNFDMTRIIMFNKQLVSDNGITDNFYTLVKDGKWTYDKFFEYAKLVSGDFDGNGVYNDKDLYGVATTMPHVTLGAFMAGAGESYVKKDNDDMPYFAAGSERFNNVFTSLVGYCFDGSYYYDGASGGSTVDTALNNMFMEDRLLFYVITVNRIPYLRSMNSDFGILPAPKYDEAQEQYHCESGNGMVAVIPQCSTETDLMGAFLELYAYYGYKYVVPAYKETAIKTKYARDEESMDMLNIIDVSRFYDLGRLYWPDHTMNKYRDAFAKKSTDITSVTESIRAKAESEIEKGIEVFTSNN